MGVFFRPKLLSGLVLIGVLVGPLAHPQDEPVQSNASFEMDSDQDGASPPSEASPPGSAPAAEDGVEPYEPSPEEPFPEGAGPADPSFDVDGLQPVADPEATTAEEPEAAPAIEGEEGGPSGEEASVPEGEQPPGQAVEEPSPSLAKESPKEKWVSPFHSKSWPGTFMAARLGFAAGNALVPRIGEEARAPLSQIAPYLGVELGATKRRWGGSFSFEGTILGPQPVFLVAPPIHYFVSLNIFRASKGSLFRWALGIRPFIHYGMETPSGDYLHLRGYGFHFGAHRLLKRTADTAFEGYVTLSMDRFTAGVAGADGVDQTDTVLITDLVGDRRLSALFLIEIGIQFAFLR